MITSISPIDGRYEKKTAVLQDYFSEYALIKYRLKVEVEYFIALCEYPLPQLEDVPKEVAASLRKLVEDFTPDHAKEIKAIEAVTNHDVKAVEYWLKERFDELNLSAYKEFIHFALTSQDINNTSFPMMIKAFVQGHLLPSITKIAEAIEARAAEWESIPMLARTHGQPASPTRLGKELRVFVARLNTQIHQLLTYRHSGKFGGATGNFNAHFVAYPSIPWESFANEFLATQLGLEHQFPTTQIEHYDGIGQLCHILSRIDTILIDFCRDIWTYISMDYFKQKINPNEVGSSAMPHKVNPIDFENAEGNLGVANALLIHFAEKLPISRLQRDLTDSTVLRNIGVPFAHITIACTSIQKGLGKLVVNTSKISQDLENNWAVVAEAIQNILRREGVEKPYELLKALTRTSTEINQATISEFITRLDVSDHIKEELRAITPHNYTGM